MKRTIFLIFTSFMISGCMTDENHGLTVITGSHFCLPKLSLQTTNTDFEIYESTDGAVVKTRKDNAVFVSYSNADTNNVFGLWTKFTKMDLTVTVCPTNLIQNGRK